MFSLEIEQSLGYMSDNIGKALYLLKSMTDCKMLSSCTTRLGSVDNQLTFSMLCVYPIGLTIPIYGKPDDVYRLVNDINEFINNQELHFKKLLVLKDPINDKSSYIQIINIYKEGVSIDGQSNKNELSNRPIK